MDTLEGKLEDNCQKRTASDAVQNLPGVRGVINNIETMVETEDTIEKKEIESAFKRNRDLNKLSLEVEVRGNKAILSGSVDSIYQKAEAERTALNAPGVKSIVNNIVVNFVQAVRD
jgi:osmotically-inducible protein OsmY